MQLAMLCLAFSLSAVPVELPRVDAQPRLTLPNPHRVRITVTQDGLSLRPLRSHTERKVTSLKGWQVAAEDRDGTLIVSLADALVPAPAAALADRIFSTDVDGWAEVWFDRGAPYSLVAMVLSTAAQRSLAQLAVGVQTPEGERCLELLLPLLDGQPAEQSLVLSLNKTTLYVSPPAASTQKLLEATQKEPVKIDLTRGDGPAKALAAVHSAVVRFEKAQSKGRPAARHAGGRWVCTDAQGKSLEARRCWQPAVVFAADPDVPWGDLAPLGSASQAVLPDVTLASF